MCLVPKQQQFIAGVPSDALRTRSDSRSGQHGETAGWYSCSRGGAVLRGAQPAGHADRHGVRKSQFPPSSGGFGITTSTVFIFVVLTSHTDTHDKLLCLITSLDWLPTLNGQEYVSANGECVFSLGDPDQNIRHLSRSSHPGAETRVTDCQYILVTHYIPPYYCKEQCVCVYNSVFVLQHQLQPGRVAHLRFERSRHSPHICCRGSQKEQAVQVRVEAPSGF